MAIQFNCISCLKAIEVADEWRNRLVECPYCGDTITAPGISQLRPPVTEPVDANAGGFATGGHESGELETGNFGSIGHGLGQSETSRRSAAGQFESADFELVQSPRRSIDVLAAIGLALGIGALAVFAWIAIRFATVLANQVGTDATPEELNRFLQDAMKSQAPWLVEMSGPAFGFLALWFAGALISLIACIRTRREHRGKLAYWAMGVSMILPFFMILSLFIRP